MHRLPNALGSLPKRLGALAVRLAAGPIAPVALVLMACLGAQGCNHGATKRTTQYLNSDGFGKDYVGNPAEEAYAKPGDSIQIADQAHPEDLDLVAQIDFDGTVLLPEIGRINIAGFSRSEIEATLIQRYSSYYVDPPRIVVQVTTSSLEYYVVGEVRQEGAFTLKPNMTIFEAVLEAVPNQDSANLGRILLIRPDPIEPLRISFNMRDFVPGGDSTRNLPLRENDIVYVPPTLVAEFGYFLRAMLFPVTTVFQALGGALFLGGGQFGGQGGFNQNRGGRSIFGFGGLF